MPHGRLPRRARHILGQDIPDCRLKRCTERGGCAGVHPACPQGLPRSDAPRWNHAYRPSMRNFAYPTHWLATRLLTVCKPGAHALIQFFHCPDERTIPVPEGWIVSALFDQQRRQARPSWRIHRWRPARSGPELLVPECRVRCLPAGGGVERRRGDDRDRVRLQLRGQDPPQRRGLELVAELGSRQPAQLEQDQRVPIQGSCQAVGDPGNVLARVGVVGARAAGQKLASAVRQQVQRDAAKGCLDVVGHLVHQQARDEPGSGSAAADHPAPLGPRNRGERDRGPIDGFLVDAKVRVDRASHPGRDPAIGERVLQDPARAGVRAPAAQAARIGELLQGGDEALAPPRPAKVGHVAYSRTALRCSAISCLNVSLSSSVNHDSSLPMMVDDRRFLSSISWSIRSSRVPSATNLWTNTFLCWPMRKARSVAWSSTAGFHQRSKWNTWLALVRFKPTPPARRDRMNTDGSRSGSWKAATSCSRLATLVPPCRYAVG